MAKSKCNWETFNASLSQMTGFNLRYTKGVNAKKTMADVVKQDPSWEADSR